MAWLLGFTGVHGVGWVVAGAGGGCGGGDVEGDVVGTSGATPDHSSSASLSIHAFAILAFCMWETASQRPMVSAAVWFSKHCM